LFDFLGLILCVVVVDENDLIFMKIIFSSSGLYEDLLRSMNVMIKEMKEQEEEEIRKKVRC